MKEERKILIISADEFEDSELTEPLNRLRDAGFRVDVAAPRKGNIRGKHGAEVEVTHTLDDIDPARYDGLLLPGGKAPAQLRKIPHVQRMVRDFVESGKPVAAICHGPQILLSADVLEGREATGYRAIAEELRRGGIHYLDQEVVVDGNLITSRHPGDLPAFIDAFLRALQRNAA